MRVTTYINGHLISTGSERSADAMVRDAEGFRAYEAVTPEDFDGLARQMGYRPHVLRMAIGSSTDRAGIVAKLRASGVKYHNADEQLADAFCSAPTEQPKEKGE